MKTFLFAWNPKKWNWATLEQSVEQIERMGSAREKWSVIAHKKIRLGDRAFLFKLGQKPKGIMASGSIVSRPFQSQHWGTEKKQVPRIFIDFDVIINPHKESILDLDVLRRGELAKINWTTQSSGIEIKEEFTDELENVWFDFLKAKKEILLFEEKEKSAIFIEGIQTQVLQTKYERNPYARKVCIGHYGLACSVCNINFEEIYGEIGKDFIHVHHLNPLASIRKEYPLNPLSDLRPVCPNCHAMIHKRSEPYSIEEMIQKMKKVIKD